MEVLNAEPRRRSKGSGPVEEVEVLKVACHAMSTSGFCCDLSTSKAAGVFLLLSILSSEQVSGSWTTEGASDPDLVRPGDRIFLRAHTGRFLDVESDHAFARWVAWFNLTAPYRYLILYLLNQGLRNA